MDVVYILLFAVHFDGDEVLVHDADGGGISEGFLLHHVAPVRTLADADEEQLVFFLRLLKPPRPRVPVDRVVGVLEEVEAASLMRALV